MQVIQTKIPGVCLIRPQVHEDVRGFFFESYHQGRLAEAGIREVFIQDNHSKSRKNTLRGLHYQLEHPQAKLCRVVQGEVLDVAVDVRLGSPYFGQWVSATLSAENKQQILIPRGFAHGFVVLSETAEFLYKCTDFYYPQYERGVLWSDADLGIAWKIANPILSAKDQAYLRLREVAPEQLPHYEPLGSGS
ncbi:MAG TPA: dTDP-4-dehydrorhamnose 3,5-epimerase [Terriglobales bacterium]|nr:dTDP-4-dehydrorhamnose 3,5-epimerase [Terriglobales bacterium]